MKVFIILAALAVIALASNVEGASMNKKIMDPPKPAPPGMDEPPKQPQAIRSRRSPHDPPQPPPPPSAVRARRSAQGPPNMPPPPQHAPMRTRRDIPFADIFLMDGPPNPPEKSHRVRRQVPPGFPEPPPGMPPIPQIPGTLH